MRHDIPGTTIFDATQARKGLPLNRMCYSFNSAENRAAFLADGDASPTTRPAGSGEEP